MFEVYYCQKSPIGTGWGSGSIRLADHGALAEWLRDNVAAGPVLVTSIVTLIRRPRDPA